MFATTCVVRGDSGGDDMAVTDDSRWMTYAELAMARGIKEPAAVRLVQRRGWERQPGNDGAVRVAVPVPELRPSRAVAPAVTLVGGDSLERETRRADQAEAALRELRAIAEQRATDLTAALVRAASAEGEARALREALDDARRPVWRRWLGIR